MTLKALHTVVGLLALAGAIGLTYYVPTIAAALFLGLLVGRITNRGV